MKKCLLTKLNGNVENNEILKLGELRIMQSVIDEPTKSTQYYLVESSGGLSASISNGYFTDESLIANLGNHIDTTSPAHLHISNSDSVISVFNKYYLTKILSHNKTAKIVAESLAFCKKLSYIDIGIIGDISLLKDCPLENISVENSEAYGDITVFSNKFKNENGNVVLNSKNIVGDISVFSGKKISILNLKLSGISGSINDLTLPNVIWLTLPKSVSGDITKISVANCNLVVNQSSVTGDVSKTNGIVRIIGPKAFQWGDGTPSNFISLDIVTFATVAEIDRMLIKEAELIEGVEKSGLTINVGCNSGSRTNASDNAVSVLKSHNVSIYINGTEQ